MKVVDENLSIRAIEDIIASGTVEELILQAHNEIKLLRIMKGWKPWEHLGTRDDADIEFESFCRNFTNDNPFGVASDRFDDMHHSK